MSTAGETKVCKRCRERLSVTEFSPTQAICRDCRREVARARRERDKRRTGTHRACRRCQRLVEHEAFSSERAMDCNDCKARAAEAHQKREAARREAQRKQEAAIRAYEEAAPGPADLPRNLRRRPFVPSPLVSIRQSSENGGGKSRQGEGSTPALTRKPAKQDPNT